MTINRSTAWKAGAVIILAALSAFLYVKFYGPPEAVAAPTIAVPPAFNRLSTLIDSHIDGIFSPLDAKMPPSPQQELLSLREDFADGATKVSLVRRGMFQTAMQLCDALLRAIKERESASLSLADSRSKAYAVGLSADKRQEEIDRRKFFEATIFRRWAEASKSHRDGVVALYSRLRKEERDLSANPGLAALPKDIVLRRATTVRLRYGSATLPAGLSLPVVGRSEAGIIVQYGGEQVTVPSE